MTYIMVDVEADGPIPGDFSMICLGAIVVEESLDRTFYGQLKPISDKWNKDALAISGFSRAETLNFDDPMIVMEKFEQWVKEVAPNKKFFASDNNGFDWMFVCWYFQHFLGRNIFGFSSTNLGSLYKGMMKDVYSSFKHLRKTKHTHNPVDDAKGNAEALLSMKKMGLKISL